mmetsp:Transcript_33018/g.105216  ORF Transcript_33018/g.105216 Transcript_33018/m.105216 type:complete len:286 (+) Transcript_33018:46-903(+)
MATCTTEMPEIDFGKVGSILGVAPVPLSDPSVGDLVTLGESLAARCPNIKGWKFGVGSTKDLRRFDPVHYDPRWYDTASSLVLACDVVTNEKASSLEQCLIDLDISVNHNASGLPCQYSASSPAIIYAVPLNEGLSIADFWATHKSYYIERQELGIGKNKARELGIIRTLAQERAMGLRDPVAVYISDQPTTHVHMDDKKWLRILLDSGLNLSALDRAMEKSSNGRLNTLTSPILKSTPQPGSTEASLLKELQKLTSGKSGLTSNEKFKRLKPMYWEMRKSATRV